VAIGDMSKTERLRGHVVDFSGAKPPEHLESDLSLCGTKLLNQPQEGGRPCPGQPCCPPDNVTLQVVRDGREVKDDIPWPLPAHIANAQRGDLFLCPGGSMGTIGGLLGALDPPQHYTHMGLFDDGGFSVRHCTMSDARVNDAIGVRSPKRFRSRGYLNEINRS